MRDQPVDRARRQIVCRKRFLRNLSQHLDGELEDRASVHVQKRRALYFAIGHSTWHRQDIAVAAVGVQMRRQYPGGVRRCEHHRAGTITKEDACSPIVPVEYPRIDFGTDHQRIPDRAALDHQICHRQRVDESAANRLNVERRAAACAQLGLQNARRRGKDHVRRCGRDDDQIEVGGCNTSNCQGLARRCQRQIAGLLVRRRNVALANAGARAHPFVAGIDPARELGVGNELRR